MAANPVRWFEIYVDDMPRAKTFYEAVFTTTLTRLNEDQPELWGFPGHPDSAGSSGALARMSGVDAGRNSSIVYFESDDCETELARIEKAGGRIQKAKQSIGQHGFIALAFDTEVNLFGLHSMR